MKKNPVCSILWEDAAYSFNSTAPTNPPNPRLTTGFIITTNEEFTFIATNVDYNRLTGVLTPVDGLIIPEKSIIEFRTFGNYHEQ